MHSLFELEQVHVGVDPVVPVLDDWAVLCFWCQKFPAFLFSVHPYLIHLLVEFDHHALSRGGVGVPHILDSLSTASILAGILCSMNCLSTIWL